jgi:peptidoglycan hydrolase-like protein with peptidoglycan-binding domain
MKYFSSVLLTFLFLLCGAPNAWAQRQPLGLPPQTIKLDAGKVGEAEAFCLDYHLYASTKLVSYSELLSDPSQVFVEVAERPPMNLPEAIRRDLVRVQGKGLTLRFINRRPQSMTIRVKRGAAFGEQPGVSPDQAALTALENPAIDKLKKRDAIWQAGTPERQLQILVDLQPTGITQASLAEAARTFQKRYGLPLTGVLDEKTKAALTKVEQEMTDRLARVGFAVNRRDTTIHSLSDPVRRYENYLGLPETGRLSETLVARIVIDEARLKQGNEVIATKQTPAAFLNSPQTAPDILTFQKINGKTAALVRAGNEPELWWKTEDGKMHRTRGQEAIEEFNFLSLITALGKSTRRPFFVQAGVYQPGEPIPVSFGPPLEVEPEKMAAFLAGQSREPVFDRILEAARVESGAEKPQIIVSRDAFYQGRGGDAGNGQSPLDGFGYRQINPLELATALSREYDNKCDVFLANDPDLALKNASRLPRFDKGSQMTIYVDKTKIGDFDTITNIKPDLKRAGIKVLKAGAAQQSEQSIVLFAGQNTLEFQDLVQQMAKEGRFKDSIIALAVCGEGNEAAFNSKLIKLSGARSVLFYNRRIRPQVVEDVLLKFSELLMKEGAPESQFPQLWIKSFEEVYKAAPASEREQVNKLLGALLQLSLPKDNPFGMPAAGGPAE